MRTYGLYMIISAIVIFIIISLIELNIGLTNYEHLRYVAWLKALSPLLIYSGIGFILYDIAAKHGIEETSKSREKQIKEQTEKKEAIMECPECNQKAKFPVSMIGSTVQCPNCKTEVNIEGIQEKTTQDEGVKEV